MSDRYKWLIFIIALVIIVGTIWILFFPLREGKKDQFKVTDSEKQAAEQKYAFPIKNFKENQTKKVFGQFITKENSPVSPERFYGYHTGVDIEVNKEDEDKGIPIYAVADGTIRSVQYDVNGYGGLVVIEHKIENQTMTGIYGHIKYFSVEKKADEFVKKGEQFAILGRAFSLETDGERKHLHFGIHKGAEIDILGYVQNKSELSGWLDPNSIYE